MADDPSLPVDRRNFTIEYTRVFAAFAIVWYHSSVIGADLAYAGLPIFVMISVYFEYRRKPTSHLSAMHLISRIGAPWIFWWVALAAYNAVRHKPIVVASSGGMLGSVLAGSYPHLWYLPFILVILIGIRIVKRISKIGLLVPLASATMFLLLMMTTHLWRAWSLGVGPPIAQYAQALPAVFLGIVLASARESRLVTVSYVVCIAAAIGVAFLPMRGVGVPVAIAGICLSAAFTLNEKFGRHLPDPTRVSKLTFGIYLIHPPLLGILKFLNNLSGALWVISTFLLALAIVWALRLIAPKLALKVT